MWQYNYDYLSHHGILGQKWGVRRFQNKDGSLTAAGKKRYGNNTDKENKGKQSPEQNKNNFKDTVKAMSIAYHYLNDPPSNNKKWDPNIEVKYMQDVVNTKAMQDFLNDTEVKKSYEKRNKYLAEHLFVDDNGDEFGPTTVYGAGIVFEKEMKKHVNNFFGEYSDKAYSDTNKNSNSKLMMKIIEEIDMLDNGKGDISPYPNEYSWLHWH